MPWTATGDLEAIDLARSIAPSMVFSELPKTPLIRPNCMEKERRLFRNKNQFKSSKQTNLLGLFGAQIPSSEGELPNQTVIAHNFWQSLERAQVGGHANGHLSNAKVGVTGGVANVSSCDQVDAGADAARVHCGDGRFVALGDRREAVLQQDDHVADELGPCGNVIPLRLVTAHHAGHHLHHVGVVDAGGEHAARAADDHRPTLLVIGNLLEAGVDLPEHVSVQGVPLLRSVQLHVQNVVMRGGHLNVVVVGVAGRVRRRRVVSPQQLHFRGGERSTGGSGHVTWLEEIERK